MPNDRPVSLELHHEVEQHLYREARLLDGYALREWIETMVDPRVRYRVVSREERHRRDKRKDAGEVPLFDDNYGVLMLRVAHFESNLQSMLDPLQRLRRMVHNVSAFHTEEEGTLRVLSYGLTMRHRRLYESEQVVYGREDTLVRGEDGALRLLERRVEIDERVIANKNVLFFF